MSEMTLTQRLNQRIEQLEAALQDIADSELSSGGQLRQRAREALESAGDKSG